MNRMRQLWSRLGLNGLRKDESGTLSVETLVMFPCLMFVFLCMLVYIKVFEQKAVLVKASEAVADTLSRETEAINQTYLNNLHTMLEYLAQPPSTGIGLRVSLVTFNESDDKNVLIWSHVSDDQSLVSSMSQTELDGKAGQIPTMKSAESALIIETYMPFSAPYIGTMFQTGITSLQFYDFVPIRPRFSAVPMCWNACGT